MKKAKFLFLAAVVFSAFTFTACAGDKAPEKKAEEEKTDDPEKKKDKDEESEFYDKDAVGDVMFLRTEGLA